ncbi:hypothetical protein AK812_SmicGene47328, partial [Symbiodinium microadriaticum]
SGSAPWRAGEGLSAVVPRIQHMQEDGRATRSPGTSDEDSWWPFGFDSSSV